MRQSPAALPLTIMGLRDVKGVGTSGPRSQQRHAGPSDSRSCSLRRLKFFFYPSCILYLCREYSLAGKLSPSWRTAGEIFFSI